jgi:peptide/nickel transport system substrate-binding protein
MRSSRRRFLGLVVLGSAGSLLAACAQTAPLAPTIAPVPAAKTTASTPRTGGTLRALAGGPRITNGQGYDPIIQTPVPVRALSILFEGLTLMQKDFSLAPSLAESWTVSPDAKAYTFKLRKGVAFHNGREMVAADVKYSLERLLDPKNLAPSRILYAAIDKIDAPDPATAVISLKQPYAPLLALLADTSAFIVPREEVDKGNFPMAPVGTGPYRFVSHEVDKMMILDKHKDYWQKGLPRIDRLEVTDVLDLQADFLRFRAGQYDVFLDGPGEQYDTIKTQYPVYWGEGTNWVYLRLNWDKVPQFKDMRVRQALGWALDREQIANFSLPAQLVKANGGGGPLIGWAAAAQPGPFPKRDVARAKLLLQEAGVGPDFKFEIQTMRSVSYLPSTVQVAQQMLQEVGVNATITVLERAPTTAQQPTIDAYMGGSPGTFDPDADMTQWFTPGGSQNYYNFDDPQTTEILVKARGAADQTERGKLYQEAQRRIFDGTSNVLHMYNNFKFDVTYPFVMGYIYNGPKIHRWPEVKDIWIDKA